MSPNDYVESCAINQSDNPSSNWRVWWKSQPKSSPEDVAAKWNSRRPRANTVEPCDQLRAVYRSSRDWRTYIQPQIFSLMDLDASKSSNFLVELLEVLSSRHIVLSTVFFLFIQTTMVTSFQLRDELISCMSDHIDILESEMLNLAISSKTKVLPMLESNTEFLHPLLPLFLTGLNQQFPNFQFKRRMVILYFLVRFVSMKILIMSSLNSLIVLLSTRAPYLA